MGMSSARLHTRFCFSYMRISYDFEENEAVLCMKNLVLEAASHPSGYKQFIGVGTSVYRGENIAPRGKVTQSPTHLMIPTDLVFVARHTFSK